MAYEDELRDPRWVLKRTEILERDRNVCQVCGGATFPMHVHHLEYHNGKKAWEYDNIYLTTYCARCHNIVHQIQEEGYKIISIQKGFYLETENYIAICTKEDKPEPFVVLFFNSQLNDVILPYAILTEKTLSSLIGILKASKPFIENKNG